jgi:murein DD-endopeptidase MepM/ murein hydrolase activator NlpD
MGAPRTSRGGGGRTTRRWRACVALVASALVLVATQAPAAADDPLADALRRKQELERAVQQTRTNAERYRKAASQFDAAVAAANSRIADLAERQRNAQNDADALAIEIQITEEQLQLVAFQLDETRSLADTLQAQSAQMGRLLVDREALYAEHLRSTYRHAQVSPMEMLLSSSSLSEFASRVQAMILIDRQDAHLAGEIRSLRELIAAREEEAKIKEGEILGLQEQIATQRAALAAKKAQYDELVRQMRLSIVAQAAERANATAAAGEARSSQRAAVQEAAALNKQLEQAEASYASLAAELAARSGLGTFRTARLLWPLNGPVTSGFGPRSGGFHNGIDIGAPMYAPVVASAAGQVLVAGRPYLASGDTAVVVIIAHGSNFSTLYGHLDDRRPPPLSHGQKVSAGQLIGYVGMTGRTTGPHLHFMTIVNGLPADPRPYLP